MTQFINMAEEAIESEEAIQLEFFGRRDEYILTTGVLFAVDIEDGIICLEGDRFHYSFKLTNWEYKDDAVIFDIEIGLLVFRKTS